MTLDVEQLGLRIARIREFKDKSLSAVAEAAGIAKSYLAKLERGEVENPGLRTLNSIARALGVTVADLLKPAESVGEREGTALLEKAKNLERLRSTLPPTLKEFLAQQERAGRPVPAEAVRLLAAVKFRGRQPRTVEDWQFFYQALVRAVGKP